MMKPSIPFETFASCDFRIGLVNEATIVDGSQKLIRLTIDFGSEIGIRTILAGLRTWYTPDTFVGKMFPFIINLPPKKMMGEESDGMMLVVDQEEKPILIKIPKTAKPGDSLG